MRYADATNASGAPINKIDYTHGCKSTKGQREFTPQLYPVYDTQGSRNLTWWYAAPFTILCRGEFTTLEEMFWSKKNRDWIMTARE